MADQTTERRLAAIVAIDVAGYSRLMGRDEEGTLARLKEHRAVTDPIGEQYGGRIVGTSGDGLLVEFPSVVNALNFAVEVQSVMAERNADIPDDEKMLLRIGINLGDVIVDDDDIYGEGVNIAARLEGLAEPGGICVSRTVRNHVRDRLDTRFADMGEVEVKNIARPVKVYRVLKDGEKAREETLQDGRALPASGRRFAVFAALAVLVALLAGGGWWWMSRPDFEPADPKKYAFKLPEKPSIAVLPFDNLSGDTSQDFVGDGITENIIAVLSTLPKLFVIARNSSFAYKGKATKVQTIAEQLGVRYVLEGSIQLSGDTLRVTAQLVDALNGRHIWANRYDRVFNAEQLFEIQDEITQKIAAALDVNLVGGQHVALHHQENLETFKLVSQSIAESQNFTPSGIQNAEKYLQKALKLSPESSSVHSQYAWVYFGKVWVRISKDIMSDLDKAKLHAEKSLSINPNQPQPYLLLATLALFKRDYDTAIRLTNKAMELAPSGGIHASVAGWVKSASGQQKEAIALLKFGMRTEPFYPDWLVTALPMSHMMLGDNTSAQNVIMGALNSDRELAPQYQAVAYVNLAIILSMQNRKEEAKSYVKKALEFAPNSSIEGRNVAFGFYKDQEIIQAQSDILRQIGFPEHPPTRLPDKPSIAVLPFTNMSDDKAQEYFVDGLTEDLITRLANIGGLFVIARNTMFTYKGKSVDVKNVGRDLGVRYVLEGSVRRSGDRLRINAQLIDATDGGHLWAKIYDRDLSDVFVVQDDVTTQISEAMRISLKPHEVQRLAHVPTQNMKAYDLFLKARKYHSKFHPLDGSLNRALELYEAAITEDPTFAEAYAYDADLSALAWRLQWSRVLPVAAARKRTQQSLERALTLNPQLPIAISVKASLLSVQGHHAETISLANDAVALAPGDHNVRQRLAYQLAVSGALNEATETMDLAVRMNPSPSVEDAWIAAYTYFHTRQYQKSVAFAQRAIKAIPDSQFVYYALVASYARLNQKTEAKKALDKIFGIIPFENWRLNMESTAYMRKDVQMHFVNAMRDAGMPEWPYGFTADGLVEMSPDEQRRELWGKRSIGSSKPFGAVEIIMDENGNWKASYPDVGFDASGSSIEQDGKICIKIDSSIGRPPSCQMFFRNPKGTQAEMNEYVAVHVYGIRKFSVFE